MAFKGIPADAFDFFEELAADNTKAWWTENKARYETNVRGPVEALFGELESTVGSVKVFRPYRDVRFAKDKTPYKENLGAVARDTDGAVHYLAISPEGLYVGGGAYWFDKEQLARFRAAVADEKTGVELTTLTGAAEKAGFEVRGEDLKRVPKPWDAEHPRARFLRHKRLYVGRTFEPAAWMGTKKAVERVAKTWREMRPVQDWVLRNVGPGAGDPQ